ncbi:MAG: MBL fold metallo-hydrolase [Bacteroidaceae bacterium]|nr:MBL fold metallo-hydrolase [Bacteroidaceae bacterium]
MKWTVLSDNRSSDCRLSTEHGLSVLLETDNHCILLDTGASDLFMRNAEILGKNLAIVDYVFISHGHSDHAGGLRFLLEQNKKAKVIISPHAMTGKFFSKRNHLHSITTLWPEIDRDRLIPVTETSEIDNGLFIIANIAHSHPMPKGNQNLLVMDEHGNYSPDAFSHELALYSDGFLFTGCAHSGLENILTSCPWPVNTVVGGFHLLDGQESDYELTALSQRLKTNFPNTIFYTSHCTGDHAFQVMKNIMGKQINNFCKE